ncbi:DUF4232 domain-containing protein [Kitasatospora sp. NPDC059571]|uniref:DUF4232 domain-containing protein n=1 Tax=Kitasatospora sp. NPDC059571 TaxID=3346871 RepID=UPI003680BBD7
MTRRRSLAAALALAAPLVVAGCNDPSGGAGDATGITAVSAPPSSAATASGAATAAPTTATGTPRPSATRTGATRSPPPTAGGGGGGGSEFCINPVLSVTKSTADGAAGTLVQRFVLTNTGSAPCSIHGRPTVVPYGPSLPVISVGAIPAGFGGLGGSGGTLVLPPGGTAAFFLKWSDVPVGDGPCPHAAGFAFRAPLDPLADADKNVPFAFQPCGSSVQVSEVLPASVTG